MNLRTVGAKGGDVPHKRDEVSVTLRMSSETHQKIKQLALRNCRTISQECAYRLLRSLEGDSEK